MYLYLLPDNVVRLLLQGIICIYDICINTYIIIIITICAYGRKLGVSLRYRAKFSYTGTSIFYIVLEATIFFFHSCANDFRSSELHRCQVSL